MSETTTQGTAPQKGGSKKLITIIVIALIVIGGAVAAYKFLGKTPKEKYFLAEKDSIDFLIDQAEERYEPELKWLEDSQEKPTENALEFTADYKDPFSSFGSSEQEEMINNSKLKIKTATDYDKKISTADIALDLSGAFEIKGIKIGLTKDEITAELPGVDETLLVKSDDLPTLLHELDPTQFTGDEEFDFGAFFEQTEVLPEKDKKYLKKEYLDMMYDELPDDAFDAEKEKVKVNNDEIKAEKVEMKLSEKQIKDILHKIFDKAETDKRLHKIIKEQFILQQYGVAMTSPSLSGVEQEADNIVENFEESMGNAKDNMDDLEIPDGLKSTVWIDKGLIVKRDLSTEIGTNGNTGEITVKGTQLLEDEKQMMDYDVRLKDDSMDETVNFKGESSWKDGKAKDSFTVKIDEGSLEYKGKETLKDGKRDFDRSLAVKDSSSDLFSVKWNGDAAFKKSSKKSNHKIAIDIPDIGSDILTLNIKNDAKFKKSIEKPNKDNVKNIGTMSEKELQEYTQEDLLPQILKEFGGGF